jgi:16S rRNA (uracil1498-N3)-methyltransferase
VLRLKTGDKITLTNGLGMFFEGEIIDDNPRKCLVKIDDAVRTEPRKGFHLHIAVAPTKNISRFEWFIEKATEIGIDEITPLECDHSERIRIKPERFEKILISALKQSQQSWLPKFNPLTDFQTLITSAKAAQKFIAFVDEQHDQTLKSAYLPGSDAIILIGPEGDFSPAEIRSAITAGFIPISLGKNRLRTETAALVAVHTINLINQK